MSNTKQWCGQNAGLSSKLQLGIGRFTKPDQKKVTASQLVAQALSVDVDDDDPRLDRNRLQDPQARDTNPYAPKANYITPTSNGK